MAIIKICIMIKNTQMTNKQIAKALKDAISASKQPTLPPGEYELDGFALLNRIRGIISILEIEDGLEGEN
jgi:hypothetical protein